MRRHPQRNTPANAVCDGVAWLRAVVDSGGRELPPRPPSTTPRFVVLSTNPVTSITPVSAAHADTPLVPLI